MDYQRVTWDALVSLRWPEVQKKIQREHVKQGNVKTKPHSKDFCINSSFGSLTY